MACFSSDMACFRLLASSNKSGKNDRCHIYFTKITLDARGLIKIWTVQIYPPFFTTFKTFFRMMASEKVQSKILACLVYSEPDFFLLKACFYYHAGLQTKTWKVSRQLLKIFCKKTLGPFRKKSSYIFPWIESFDLWLWFFQVHYEPFDNDLQYIIKYK